MDTVKVYTPTTIPDQPFPQQGEADYGATTPSTGGGQVFSPTETKQQTFPTKKIATELLSSALNTRSQRIIKEFQFTQSGALQIGKYENGVTGDLRLSPNGITGRNSAGITTFAIDATSGDAVFSGTLQSSSLITGTVAVGDGNIVIDGENGRMIWYDESTGLPIIVIGNVG